MASSGPFASASMVVAAASPLEAVERGASTLAHVVRGVVDERRPDHLVAIGVGPGNVPAVTLAAADLPWGRVHVFQLEERVAADGDATRHDELLRMALARVPLPPTHLHLLPTGASDSAAALRRYEEELAAAVGRLDVVVTAARHGADAGGAATLAVEPSLLRGAIDLRLEVRRPAAEVRGASSTISRPTPAARR